MVNALIFDPDTTDEFFQRTANSGFVIGEKIQFAHLILGFQAIERFKDFDSLSGEFGININFSPVKQQPTIGSDFFSMVVRTTQNFPAYRECSEERNSPARLIWWRTVFL